MQKVRRDVGVPTLLALAAFMLAFAQRPGLATADTKINLHVDPARFLGDVASMWSSTGQLGGVQAGQQVGYLFPMGPFFAFGHGLGLADWVIQRLWLGAVLALAAWGMVRLLDALLGRPRGIAHLVSGAVILLNPFVVTYVNRTTVTLLAYAALPWLLLAVHRGLRAPRRWRWPAAVALLVTASGGGVNGAVTAWMLLGPVLLALYEVRMRGIERRALTGFAVRVVPLTAIASLWWVIPAYVQARYGNDFLRFTEQPGTVWGTTSVTESLRLMSFWLSYVGIGFAGRAIPYFDDTPTLLFSLPVVVATLLVPALALTGFVWTRRWRYGPFFLLLALVGVLVMTAGFPEGTPLRHGLYFTYNHVASLRFLRASYKAAPLLAVALAALAGAGASAGWLRLARLPRARGWQSAAGAGALLVLALAAWPLVTGRAQDAQVSFRGVPAAWKQVAADLDRGLAPNSRAMVLPGELFSFYTWGGTVDPILPALSHRPVAERSEVPYSDPRAADLLWTIDGLVHQGRLLPGQLGPLLSLIGVRSVVSAADADLARSDAMAPADAARELGTQARFQRASGSYGPVRRYASGSGIDASLPLPEVRRYDLAAARGIVRVEPRAAPILVDGSAQGLAGLAAFGALPSDRALQFTGDISAPVLQAAAAGGAEVEISDSNRRQAFAAGSLEQNTGPVLPASQGVSADGIISDPFGRGVGDETVATFTGISSVQAPASPQRVQFPEHRPFAALDGSPATAWLADPTLDPGRHWLQVNLLAPRPVPYVDLLPYGDAGGIVRQVQIAGRSFAVHPGWNRLVLGLPATVALRVSITQLSPPAAGASAGAGGISELRIPGVRVQEELALPRDGAQALAGRDLGRVTLGYLFHRTTGDDPYRRDQAHGAWSALDVHEPGDAELTMRRSFVLPAVRRFTATAWVNVSAQAADDEVDRLAGLRGGVDLTSSSRFDGEPRWRASGALDRDPATAWIGDYRGGGGAWLEIRAPRAFAVSQLRLLAPELPVARVRRVRLSWPGGSTPPLAVDPGGRLRLAQPVRTRRLRITVLDAVPPLGASAADARAVGIAEVQGLRGLAPVRPSRTAAIVMPCGAATLRVGGAAVRFEVRATREAFDRGDPLPARSCGRAVQLGAGTQHLAVDPGPLAVDELRLLSPAPRPVVTPGPSGRVLTPGTFGRDSVSGVRLAVAAPSWLVLGEGYNRGWQAWCDGHSLGSPVPLDGYANAWPVPAGCRSAHFSFGPQASAGAGYVISALGALLCLILGGLRRGRARALQSEEGAARSWEAGNVPSPARLRPPAAGLGAVAVAVAFGFVFGIRAGAVCLPVVALILWRGVGAGRLTAAAGVLVGVVVPLLYVLHPPSAGGGNHFGYATEHMTAHWVGVAAIGLLLAALGRTLRLRR